MSIPTKHSLTRLVGLAVPPDGDRCVGDGVGFGVLVTGDRVGLGVLVVGNCVGSRVVVVCDRVGALLGDLVRAMGFVGRTLEGEKGIVVGTESDVGKIAVGDGASDGRLGSFRAVLIVF